jgi:hypothetical protein
MNRHFSCIGAFLIVCLGGALAQAAPARSLETELNGLLTLVVDAVEKDVALKGRTLSLGRIASEDRPDSNYAPELRRLFELRLKGKLVGDGLLKMTVDYDLTDSEVDVAAGDETGKKMKVLIIRVVIKDDKKKELFNKSVEINETADIARVLGVTVAPPPNGNQAERNKKLDEAFNQNKGKPADQVKPTFHVRNGAQIGVPGSDKFFVEILVKDAPAGPARPIAPVPNPLGNAFVDIKGNQFYEIVAHNNDEFACVAKIRIDGQDAMNRFNADGVQYTGLLIEKGKSGALKGWMHTAKPRPKEKDNVFSFKVREYAFGSGNPVPASGEVGVITVQFAVAWKEGEARPAGRSIGRDTDKGPGLEQNFKVEKRQVGEFNETISIRYSPSAK